MTPIAVGSTPDVVINPVTESFAVAYQQSDPKDLTSQSVAVCEMDSCLKPLAPAWSVGKNTSEPALSTDANGHYLLTFSELVASTFKPNTLARNIKGQLGLLK